MSLDPIAALRASHERLRATVTPLTPEQLRGPGYPSEWTVAQVLSHLGSGAEIMSLAVDTAPEPAPRDAYQPIWDVWNAKDADAMAADGLASDADLVARIEALAADTDARYQVWSGEVDIAGLAESRLFEHALHTWDVEVAASPGATLPADATAIILPGLGRLIGFVAKPSAFSGRVHVTTTDPAGEYVLTLGESTAWAPWDGGAADATLRIPAEALVRLVYGRLDPANTPTTTEADGIDLDTLRTTFPGF